MIHQVNKISVATPQRLTIQVIIGKADIKPLCQPAAELQIVLRLTSMEVTKFMS